MKKLITKGMFIFALLGGSLSIASQTFIDDATNKEYSVMSTTELGEAGIERFCKGEMDGVILSIEGATLLVDVELNSNIFEGKIHTPRKITVLKSCFMKCEKGIHSFSSDYRNWKPFREFFDTDLDVSVDICPETSLVKLTFHLDLYQNKK